MHWKETLPLLLNIWRSGFGFSLWRSFWPLFMIKFQYFMIHGILFFPQQFIGLSWGNCQVWRFCECLEGFYFTAERQFDGLVQKELRFTQLDCLFWLNIFVMPEVKEGYTVNSDILLSYSFYTSAAFVPCLCTRSYYATDKSAPISGSSVQVLWLSCYEGCTEVGCLF